MQKIMELLALILSFTIKHQNSMDSRAYLKNVIYKEQVRNEWKELIALILLKYGLQTIIMWLL